MHESYGPPDSTTQMASQSISSFLQAHNRDRQTDRQTMLLHLLTTGRTYVRTTAMCPRNEPIQKRPHLVENDQRRPTASAWDLFVASLQQVATVVTRSNVDVAVRRENTVEAAAAAWTTKSFTFVRERRVRQLLCTANRSTTDCTSLCVSPDTCTVVPISQRWHTALHGAPHCPTRCVFRTHHSTTYVDAASCYRRSSVVWCSVCHDHESCKNCTNWSTCCLGCGLGWAKGIMC